eukprot:472199-Prymnesium_polylepis.1
MALFPPTDDPVEPLAASSTKNSRCCCSSTARSAASVAACCNACSSTESHELRDRVQVGGLPHWLFLRSVWHVSRWEPARWEPAPFPGPAKNELRLLPMALAETRLTL